MSDSSDRDPVVTHPSGWWKARDGKWYRPNHEADTTTDDAGDLVNALSIAVGAIVIGSLLPWSVRGASDLGNLTLLLGGVAGALIARWRLFSRDPRLLTASALLCAGASAVLVLNVVSLRASQPQGGVFLAMVGALMATALAVTTRRLRPSVIRY